MEMEFVVDLLLNEGEWKGIMVVSKCKRAVTLHMLIQYQEALLHYLHL